MLKKVNRQKTGQSSASPFMRVCTGNQFSIRTRKGAVTFNAMETIKRNSDSIDKLMSLVSKMNMKMDKRETP